MRCRRSRRTGPAPDERYPRSRRRGTSHFTGDAGDAADAEAGNSSPDQEVVEFEARSNTPQVSEGAVEEEALDCDSEHHHAHPRIAPDP